MQPQEGGAIKMGYYDYSTSTLQNESIEELEILNSNIENTNSILTIIAIILVLTYITSFIRNIF